MHDRQFINQLNTVKFNQTFLQQEDKVNLFMTIFSSQLNNLAIIYLRLFLQVLLCFHHPYIHFLYPLNPTVRSRGGAGAYPSSRQARGGVHPGQVASLLCFRLSKLKVLRSYFI